MGIKASAQYTITEINEEYSVVISNESHVFRADKNNTVVAGNTSIQIYGYQGSTQIATKVGTISGLPSAGMKATINNNSSTNTSITIAVTTALTSSVANNGTLTIPITVGNKTINKVFSWSKAQTGATGSTGATGTAAKVCNVTPSAQVFKSTTGANGTFTPQYIYLYPTFQNCTFSKWQYSTDGTTWKDVASGSNSFTIGTYSSIANSLRVERNSNIFTSSVTAISFKLVTSDSTIYDTTTIVKIYDVTDLQIGGRNYVINSNFSKGLLTRSSNSEGWTYGAGSTLSSDVKFDGNNTIHRYRTGTTSTSWAEMQYYHYRDLTKETNVNEQWTLSFWVYVANSEWIDVSTNSIASAVRIFNSSNTKIGDISIPDLKTVLKNSIGKWTRYVCTFSIPASLDYTYFYFFNSPARDYDFYLANYKLEKGNVATDWTPAPEDIEDEILQRPTQGAVTDQISQSLKNATDSIDQTIAEKIGQSRAEIDTSTDKKIEAANKSVRQEIDSTTGEKIRDLEYFASQMTLKGNEFSIGIEKTKGVNLIKNSVMKQHKERGGSGANSKNIKANFWLNNSLSEDYFPNIIYGEDSLSRSNTDSGNYFRFNLVSSNNTQLDYIFSDPIDFKKNTSNIILSYKLRQMQKITNGVFFIGLVFYRQDTSTTGMGAVSKTAGIPTSYYVPVTEYSNTNLTGSFSGDYIYKIMPITRQGNIKVEETVEVKETISNGEVTEKYINLTYTPSSSNPTVNILSYGSGATEQFKATNKKVVLRLADTRKVVTVQYIRDLQNFVAMDSPTDAKIKAALANIPVSEVTIYYNSSSKKIWTYNPFTGAFIETSNLYDTTVTDTNINTVRVVMGVRSTNSSAITGQIDISDIKLEYDSVSTIWTQNVGETYSKQYKMDEKGFSISSDTNTMFIDEDEIAAYKSNENGKLDMNNPVFQIKEDETILRQTTIYDQLNIENTNETRADAFVMKQQLIGGKWYFIFY